MKVMFPRAGYARKGGEWPLRVGEGVVMVMVCVRVLGVDARWLSRQRALAQLDIAKTLASRMQRLELRPGREPIHTL